MRFILSVLLERTVRFVATVDAVLEKYNSCLSNNKWLGANHVSIVFESRDVEDVLQMISWTSNNAVSNSSMWLQKASDCKK